MASELATVTSAFGLLLFCPYPERGERVCVGIWFDDGRRTNVEFDPSFYKIRCISPGFEPELVRTTLDDLDHSLSNVSGPEALRVIRQYAPQIVSTDPRTVFVPLTREVREQLRNKFLAPPTAISTERVATLMTKKLSSDQAIVQRVHDYVRSIMRDTKATIVERPTPYTLFGMKSPVATPSVALAVERAQRLVLVDGVDLNVVKGKRAINRVNHVVWAFWEFQRAKSEALISRERALRRVGIVFNGALRHDRAFLDIHDYALRRFSSEAEVTVDATTSEGRDQLDATLNA